MFFIASPPRTRTYWLAQYFDGLPGVTCFHELLNGMESREQFYEIMECNGQIGDSDSGLFMTDFQDRWPDAPTLIVERDTGDIAASLRSYLEGQGLPEVPQDILEDHQAKIGDLAGLRVPFEDLDNRLPEVHYYFGIPYIEEYARHMAGTRLELPKLVIGGNSYQNWN